ncbi:hypothetical protein [Alkalinema sp. FACHB-956]|uniref:DUF6930 domain-containing protein n=1 Tax=Alkalinema sp. FACHB-956 TaxID=2692768 RepID=UPI001689D99A|nr:hypothetical protein [Alkalinema sp. FACHB-956]MBD2325864.1 hypothetical protein [Alkalinema sp. FACHB-956]
MTALNHATQRRLLNLPQIPSVWEGDRRSLSTAELSLLSSDSASMGGGRAEGDCVLWVDGSQGIVRAMDMVAPTAGPETVVRTLLRAIEYPHSPAQPARPQKIVVRDREMQFYLRGILQELDIALEYVPDLPLIDEIFQSFQTAMVGKPPNLPPQFAEELVNKAQQLWNDAPWSLLGDHQILAIELNHWDLGTVYASIMGMLGMEFGILLYRSLDSLQRFRQRVLDDDSMERMEEAFLSQDCLFLTYEAEGGRDFSPPTMLRVLPPVEDYEPVFGSLHPLEGLRSALYEEEAQAFAVVLEALHCFFEQHHSKFADGQFPEVSSRYDIPVPGVPESPLSIQVSTLPDLAEELFAMAEDESDLPMIRDDLIPENAFLSLGVMPWDTLKMVRSQVKYHQMADIPEAGEGLPVVLVQTSQPKAKALIQELQTSGGLRGIGFNPGADSMMGEQYDLGLLQTEDETLFLFGEFGDSDPVHIQARKKWDQRCKKTKGYCGLLVAKGVTGSSKGQPKITDMVGLFEVHALSASDLGLGVLERQFLADWL